MMVLDAGELGSHPEDVTDVDDIAFLLNRLQVALVKAASQDAAW